MKIESGKWRVFSLRDLGDWGSGGTPRKGRDGYYGGNIPWLKISDLNDGEIFVAENAITEDGLKNSSAKWIQPGSVLIAMYGSIGKLGIARIPCTSNQAIAYVYPNEKLTTTEFLYWLLFSMRKDLVYLGKGGTQSNISQDVLKKIDVKLPPLSEQKRIVARIQECMEKVQEIERLRAETETEIKALSASAINSLDVGQYPLCEVGDLIIEMRNGRSIKPTGVNSNGTILTLGAVRSIDIDMASQKAIPLDAKTAKDFAFQKDDVFISRANTIDLVGLSGIALNDSAPWMIYPDLLIKIKVDPKKILPRYLTQALRFPSTREQIRQFAKGTSKSMVKISGAEVRKLKLPLPSLKEQQTLLTRIEGIQSVVSKLNVEQKDQNPSLIRESILRKAFAGEL